MTANPDGVRLLALCDWPADTQFTFLDEPGEHAPCYVVMPGGAMLSINHHAGDGVDIARAKFIIAACNDALNGEIERWKSVAKTEADGRDRMGKLAAERLSRAAPVPQCDAEPVACKADLYALWCDECNVHPSKCPLRAAPARCDAENVTVSRKWVEHTISCLQGDLPSGRIGDAVFLLRDILQDILDARPPALPAGEEVQDVDMIAGVLYESEYGSESYVYREASTTEQSEYRRLARALLSRFAIRALSPSSNGKPAT